MRKPERRRTLFCATTSALVLAASRVVAEPMNNPVAGFQPPAFIQVAIFAFIALILVVAAIRNVHVVIVLALLGLVGWVYYGPLNFNFLSSVALTWVTLGVPAIIANAVMTSRRKRAGTT